MQRRQLDKAVTERRRREHLRHNKISSPESIPLGRFRKIAGLGCNKARCLLCKCHKIYREPTRQEEQNTTRFHEGLAELNER